MAVWPHPRASFDALPLELKLSIFEQLVEEDAPIPVARFIPTLPIGIRSLLDQCPLIRASLDDGQLLRLSRIYITTNTFSFDDLRHLDLIVALAGVPRLEMLRSIRIAGYWTAPTWTFSSWKFTPFQLFNLTRFQNLTRLALVAGSIDNIPTPREQLWMATASSARKWRYSVMLLYLISKLPALPVGLRLEVRVEVSSISPGLRPVESRLVSPSIWPDEPRSAGKVLVDITTTRYGTGTGQQAGAAWREAVFVEEVQGWSCDALEASADYVVGRPDLVDGPGGVGYLSSSCLTVESR